MRTYTAIELQRASNEPQECAVCHDKEVGPALLFICRNSLTNHVDIHCYFVVQLRVVTLRAFTSSAFCVSGFVSTASRGASVHVTFVVFVAFSSILLSSISD